MSQLRTQLDEAAFLERVQRQRMSGYRLAAGRVNGRVAAVAGFVLGEKLAWGRHLYVDDLVTDAGARSLGVGRAMLDWLKRFAVEAGCASLHLDSGIQRADAHRFYEREALLRTSAHFAIDLASSPRVLATAAPVSDAMPNGARRIIDSLPLGEGGHAPHPAGFEATDPDDYEDPSHEGGLDPDFR
jgi:GNAT superfamily N-acetyltransferase